ncbi:IS66 family insertion sequence element accessory protein TnpB, partial [Pseudogemmobacter sp. W21_MBD1_M6]|uniref:IS66 family insertion sequence element accessory protein TnpB n=1 Tax=Pseudogemmobacter sp. W21_MBD1_M6 TaxID=3240271 RepID=UPI003F99BFE1
QPTKTNRRNPSLNSKGHCLKVVDTFRTVVFRSKRGDRLKILVWDGTGLVLIYKRLEVSNFVWPKIEDGVMQLSRAQYEALFEGLDWRRMVAKPVVAPAAAG